MHHKMNNTPSSGRNGRNEVRLGVIEAQSSVLDNGADPGLGRWTTEYKDEYPGYLVKNCPSALSAL